MQQLFDYQFSRSAGKLGLLLHDYAMRQYRHGSLLDLMRCDIVASRQERQ